MHVIFQQCGAQVQHCVLSVSYVCLEHVAGLPFVRPAGCGCLLYSLGDGTETGCGRLVSALYLVPLCATMLWVVPGPLQFCFILDLHRAGRYGKQPPFINYQLRGW